MFGLVAATFFTLPFAFGAGGLLYYGLRREHRVCPRCGHGWGRRAAGASIVTAARPAPVHATAAGGPISSGGYEGVLRGWSIVMAVVGAILVVAGAIEAELLLLVLGVLCGLGAVGLHRSANRARNRRRDAILATLQMHVLKLARERAGRLTVTEVAASLGWPMRRADKVLQSLDDGWRVDSAVTDEGVIVYEFLELVHARKPLPPTRSADEESDGYPRASSG